MTDEEEQEEGGGGRGRVRLFAAQRGTQEQEGTEAGPVASETTPLAPLARRNRSPINAHSFQEGEERWSTASAAAGERSRISR